MTDPVNAEQAEGSDTPIFDAVADESPAEAAADAELRQWAKDNGIEGVPASGRLSATWREQIISAMASALAPKEEASVEATSSEPSTSPEEMTETTSDGPTEPESAPEEESKAEMKWEPSLPNTPEFETGTYRSVFYPPNTFVTSQVFTA